MRDKLYCIIRGEDVQHNCTVCSGDTDEGFVDTNDKFQMNRILYVSGKGSVAKHSMRVNGHHERKLTK